MEIKRDSLIAQYLFLRTAQILYISLHRKPVKLTTSRLIWEAFSDADIIARKLFVQPVRLSAARYSFTQLDELEQGEDKGFAKTSKLRTITWTVNSYCFTDIVQLQFESFC